MIFRKMETVFGNDHAQIKMEVTMVCIKCIGR
jgi:hypothetical protein